MSVTETAQTTSVAIPRKADRTVSDDANVVRAWAKSVGLPVGARGRVTLAVRESYVKGDKRPGLKALNSRRTPDARIKGIRVWAAQQGLTVGARGRLSAETVAAFDAAQSEQTSETVTAE